MRTASWIVRGLVICGLGLVFLGGCATTADVVSAGIQKATVSWGDDAQPYRGRLGAEISIVLPPAGSGGDVWGTDVYTDDSSIGVAAVHAGLITFAGGGQVTIRILPGQLSYPGSTRNGVTSSDWDEWEGSFEFVK